MAVLGIQGFDGLRVYSGLGLRVCRGFRELFGLGSEKGFADRRVSDFWGLRRPSSWVEVHDFVPTVSDPGYSVA